MIQVKTISSSILLSSELLSAEDSFGLSIQLKQRIQLTASEIIELDLPARNRVEALLQEEFLEEKQLQELACSFADHTLKIFEACLSNEHGPRRMVDIARLYYAGGASEEELKAAFIDTWRAIEGFNNENCNALFAAGLAVSLLNSDEADKMARGVAVWAQNAAHLREWESRRSNFEAINAREREAAWQLKRIVSKLQQKIYQRVHSSTPLD